ncbi:MAG TPA: SDR family NAD(P)-dependent oxidoreductase [Solirubrobacteraceae bacterium]|nr:SDR family NAD(P)-dependent oxidoreductase [Solirubrobacteraceae bacterium]
MSRVFVTGGSGVVGRALVERLVSGGDEVVALARSRPAEETLRGLGAVAVPGELFDEDALASGMAGCSLVYNVAGVNTLCVEDPEPMLKTNIAGPPVVVRAAARAGVARIVHTSSAATIGEPSGVVGREDTPHRGWYLSTYERSKTEGERAVFEAGRDHGVEIVSVNPSSVQGPGRSGGTARFLLAYLDGRLKVFVPTNVSLVDIDDCAEGHVLAAERGVAGERYLLNSIALSISEALALAGEVAGVEGRPRLVPRQVAVAGAWVVEHGSRLARRKPPVCREMVRTLLHGHIYDGSRASRDLGLRYTEPRETLRKTVDWARAEGLLSAA